MKRLFLLMIIGLFLGACGEPADVTGIYSCDRVNGRADAREAFMGHTFSVYTMPNTGGIAVRLDDDLEIIEFEPDGRNKYRMIEYTYGGYEVFHTIKFSGKKMHYKIENTAKRNGKTQIVDVYANKQQPIIE